MSEKIAIFLIARDDGISIEDAEIMWNGWKAVAQEGHRGDCTGEANTCAKCLVDKQYRDADQIHKEYKDWFKQEIEKLKPLSESEIERAIYIGLTKKRQTREIAIALAQLQDCKDTLLRMME